MIKALLFFCLVAAIYAKPNEPKSAVFINQRPLKPANGCNCTTARWGLWTGTNCDGQGQKKLCDGSCLKLSGVHKSFDVVTSNTLSVYPLNLGQQSRRR